MANGKVTINTDAVTQVLGKITNSCAILESDVSGKIPGNFQVLVDLGLLSGSLSKLQTQTQDLISVHKSLIGEITSHLEVTTSTEDELYNYANNHNYGSSGNNGGNGDNTPIKPSDDLAVDDEDDGKEINAEELIEAIPKLDEETLIELIEFLNINKGSETTLVELLLDNTKSKKLFTLLRQIFGAKDELEGVSLEDYKKVQKALLDAIVTQETTYKELSENSILVAKEYLIEIGKKNNISPSDLLLEEKYRDILKEELLKLYDGDVDDSISKETIENYRKYIDKVAGQNNMEADTLITKKFETLL